MREELSKRESELRNHILDKAYQVFSEKSYAKTSLRDLMECANVNRKEISYFFKNKFEIFLALEYRNNKEKRNVILSKAKINDNPDEVLKNYICSRLRLFNEENYHNWIRLSTEFWSLPRTNPQIDQLINKRFLAFHQDIHQLIENGINKGVFKEDVDYNTFIYYIISLILGIGDVSGCFGRTVNENQIETISEIVLSYIRR